MYCENCNSDKNIEQIGGKWYMCWNCHFTFEIVSCEIIPPTDILTDRMTNDLQEIYGGLDNAK